MAKVIMDLVLLLAMCMQGETRVLDSDAAALAVYEVAHNRKIAFGMNLHGALIEGFFGWKTVAKEDIEPRYVRLACRVLSGEHPPWNHNALYMLSREDLIMLGGVDHPPVKRYAANGFAVYLYERWPR